MSDKAYVLTCIQAILKQQVQCVLATQHNGDLFQHLMAYAAEDCASTVYFASLASTQKVRNMKACPIVSMLWDNRTGNNTDHTEGFALSARGSATFVSTQDQARVQQALLSRNSTLAALFDQPDAITIAVRIQSYHLALGYREAFHYEP